jgi:hypothetical protein
LVGPARIGVLAAVLFGVASLDGCNSLSGGAASAIVVSTSGDGGDGGPGGWTPPEAGPSTGASCQPGNVETFVAGAYVPALEGSQGACAPIDGVDPMQLYYEDCFGPSASRVACDAFGQISPAYGACKACIVTAATAPAYGPLVLAGGFVQANVAGCIELVDPSDLLCAQTQQALADCELAACSAKCPVTDQASLVAYEACAAQADATGCQAFYEAAQCLNADGGLDGGPEMACLETSFQAFYDAVVPLFCGQSSTDASVGAPTVAEAGTADASSDASGGDHSDAMGPDSPVEASEAADGGSLPDDAAPPGLADGPDAL